MPVPAIVSWLDDNWETIECQFYGGIQQGALSAAYSSVFTGKFPLALGLAGVSYAAKWTAEQVGCNYRPPEPDNPPAIGGCKQISQTPWTKNNFGTLYANRTDYDEPGALIGVYVVSIDSIEDFKVGGLPAWKINWTAISNADKSVNGNEAPTYSQDLYYFYKSSLRYPIATLIPNGDATCEIPAPDAGPGPHNPGDPIADPINHVISSCNWTIQATDAYVDDQLRMHTYYTITARDETCGGPFAYWSSDKGPQWVAPEPPKPPDGPDGPQPPLPPPDYNPRFDDIDDDLDKIQEELEKLKECACPEKPELAKHWRSIRFESDEPSPNSRTRLHKLFRYRGNSAGIVESVAAHWKDFRWRTGPTCVFHKGSPLGTPQVWAASIDEGKRVIRHAGGEAGIDPDQVGEWGVSGSDNPRYGVSLEVGLYCVDGCWSSTARPGPNGWPEAGQVLPDP